MGSSSPRGIQTMTNCPGPPPKSARNRYVVVWWLSRTTSMRGTTWSLLMGGPHGVLDGCDPEVLEDPGGFLEDLVEGPEPARQESRAHRHRHRPRHDVLEGVAPRRDPAHPDHGDVDSRVDVVHRAHADGADRGPAQAAVAVREDGHAGPRGDGHRLA